MYDTHAHILSDDLAAYPPSARGLAGPTVGSYTTEQLLEDMDACGVSSACAVQRFHYYEHDNSYALDAARGHPERLTPVIMLDAFTPSAAEKLRAVAQEQKIGGLRFANPDVKAYDTGWMNSPPVMKLWEAAAELNIPVAIIFLLTHLPYNLPALGMIAQEFPGLPIAIDHMGVACGPVGYLHVLGEGRVLPYPGPPEYGFSQALKDLRRHRNIHFKFTGINLEYLAHHGIDAAGFIRAFVDEFGSHRVMCGTDIGQTKGPYGRIVGELRAALSLLNEGERQDLLFETARRIYG